MYAAPDLFCVPMVRLRLTSFRLAIAFAGTFFLCTAALFGLIYWQATVYLTDRFDSVIMRRAEVIAAMPPGQWASAVQQRVNEDPARLLSAGLFSADGRRITGNVATLPFHAAGGPRDAIIQRIDPDGQHAQRIRAVVRKLNRGEWLIVGRNIQENQEIAEIIGRGLALGLLPALGLAILAGAMLSMAARQRIEELTALAGQIAAGDLHQRLPVIERDHPYDKLSVIINGMMEHMESLVGQLANVGNDIAHDLRTPLTRVRTTLERARENAQTLDELRAAADRAIDGLDKSLSIVTALLRIAAIEHGRRVVEFGTVDLAEIAAEAVELYGPMAETRNIQLCADFAENASVTGDRDLLFEAAANLIDNAIKFTPDNGKIEVRVTRADGHTLLRVRDTGPGISEEEREAVTRRFYRADKSRRTPGVGLGLSLVSAIAKLHGFRLVINGGPGCTIEILCPNSDASR
jgi:signal transduction histidine kinase